MIKTSLFKKLMLPVAAVVVVGGLAVASGQADAIFNFSRSNLKVTGTVVEITDNSFILDTDSSDPAFELRVNNKTNFKDPLNNLEDLNVGDEVRVRAKVDSNSFRYATKVELVNDASYGYGTSCGRFRITRAQVVSINSSQLVVKRAGVNFNIGVNDDTVIRGHKHNRNVKAGDIVDVRGQDCGNGSWVAEKIVVRDPRGRHDDHDQHDDNNGHHDNNHNDNNHHDNDDDDDDR